MPQPFYSLNDLFYTVRPRVVTLATGQMSDLNGATDVTSFIATSDDERAVPVDDSFVFPLAETVKSASNPTPKGEYLGHPDASELQAALLRRYFGPPPVDGVFFSDAFTRTNSALTMGGNWSPMGTGAVWGIDTNRAYGVTDNGEAFVTTQDTNNPNVIIRATVAVQTFGGGITFRLVPETTPGDSTASFYVAYVKTDSLALEYWVDSGSGTRTECVRRSYTYDATHILVVACRGSEIVIRIMSATATEAMILDHEVVAGADEIARLTWFDTHEDAQADRHGLFAFGGEARFDNVSIAAAEPPEPWLIVELEDAFRVAAQLEWSGSRLAEVEE